MQKQKLKDLLQTPLDSNTYLVNAQADSGWMPVGGLTLSMLPDDFQKRWSDVLESPVDKIVNDGAYGKEIHLADVNDKRLQDFPFAIQPFYGQDTQNISTGRKAELFDRLLDSLDLSIFDIDWHTAFGVLGMTDDEMRSTGLNLPELKVTEHSVKEMAEYVVQQIKEAEMGETQTHITLDIGDLAKRFGFDLKSCMYAEDMLFEELYTRDEIDGGEIADGSLRIKPADNLLPRFGAEPQPTMGL